MTDSSKSFLKILFGVVLTLCVLGALALVRMLSFEQEVPRAVLNRAAAKLTDVNSNLLVTVESASFRLTRGVTLRNVKVYDRFPHPLRADRTKPLVMSASRVDLELDLLHLPWSRESVLRGVTLEDFRYPRLPEGYYIPDSIEKPGQPDFRETNARVKLSLPRLNPFRVRLIRPEVLRVAPKILDIPRVRLTEKGLRAERMHMELADSDAPVTMDGDFGLDLAAQRIRGEVRGHTRQHHVRPMLEAIDITNSYQFIDAFTNVEPPVPALCRYDVNLLNNDLHLFIDLHVPGGRYHGVPLKQTDGSLDISVFVRDVYQNADIRINLDRVLLADGSSMKGLVRYCNTNDVGFVDFDVDGRTSLSNALAIADVMTDGTLDSLCVTGAPPHITLKGRVAVRPDQHPELNDLRGTLAFGTGSLLDIPLRDVTSKFFVKGSRIDFRDASARTKRGGQASGVGSLVFRDCWTPPATFNVDLACTNVPLSDLAEVFAFDVGEKHGFVDGRVALSGPVGTNAVARLNGGGRIVCRDGTLAQFKVYEGLTSFLARNVFGGAQVERATSLDFSRSTCDFTITNGVYRTSNLVVEGRVISIVAAGSYDIPRDDLDFSVRVKLLKWDLGGIPNPIAWVSSSLLDFTVTGPIASPRWSYSKNPLRLLNLLPWSSKPGAGR